MIRTDVTRVEGVRTEDLLTGDIRSQLTGHSLPLSPRKYTRHQTKQNVNVWQKQYLMDCFQRNRFPRTDEIEEIASRIGMRNYSVRFWFQNQRQRIAKVEKH